MDASILQNPADPDATYREKAGKQNRGYAANLTEACGEEGSIVTDYQYDTNTHSDAAFTMKALDGGHVDVRARTRRHMDIGRASRYEYVGR